MPTSGGLLTLSGRYRNYAIRLPLLGLLLASMILPVVLMADPGTTTIALLVAVSAPNLLALPWYWIRVGRHAN